MDTLCHKLPNFIDKCSRAGVKRVYIGLENINPANLLAAKKKQNKITEYRKMLLAWKAAGMIVYAGYITGFPNDTIESIMRDMEVIKRELPIDVLEIFFLTPLPGSEDHQKLFRAGDGWSPISTSTTSITSPPNIRGCRAEEWNRAYDELWRTYYSYEHCETIMRRAAALRTFGSKLFAITWFKGCIELENVHPVESGILRLKFRRDRRPSLPMEPVW